MGNVKKKILVVEDDGALLNVLVDRLETTRTYMVLKAADGEEAVKQIFENRPHLILLDLLLPKLDGFKVLEKIRAAKEEEIQTCKVVVLSNLWSNKDILKAQALKIEEYFVKANTNLNEVMAKVKMLLP